LARKKRIEEIMARTRGSKGGGGGAAPAAPTPSTPSTPTPVPAKPEGEAQSSPTQQPASLDPLGDPTKPEPEVEKGALDSLSLKSEDTENSSPLITLENGVPNKKSNGVVDGGNFDQILDLGDLGDSNKEERAQGIPSPIRAFEENNSQQNNTTGALGVRDLLS